MFDNSMLLLFLSCFIALLNAEADFYSFSVLDSDGKLIQLEKYRGQVTLVVNVASECGFTDKHYKGLVNAKNLLQGTGKFEILAFPCNQFGAQEPKGIADILDFAQKTYDVNFPIFEKLKVIDDAADIYKHLTKKTGNAPSWNFWKYLVDHTGDVIGFWGPWSDVEEAFPSMRLAVEAAIADSRRSQMPSSQARPPPPPGGDGSGPTRQARQPGTGSEKPSGPPPPPPHDADHSAPDRRETGPPDSRHTGPPDSVPSRSGPPSSRAEGKPPAHNTPAYKHDDL